VSLRFTSSRSVVRTLSSARGASGGAAVRRCPTASHRPIPRPLSLTAADRAGGPRSGRSGRSAGAPISGSACSPCLCLGKWHRGRRRRRDQMPSSQDGHDEAALGSLSVDATMKARCSCTPRENVLRLRLASADLKRHARTAGSAWYGQMHKSLVAQGFLITGVRRDPEESATDGSQFRSQRVADPWTVTSDRRGRLTQVLVAAGVSGRRGD
jgi:hypothetical protein